MEHFGVINQELLQQYLYTMEILLKQKLGMEMNMMVDGEILLIDIQVQYV